MEPEGSRRLAAIMFTDIVGYTALMAESEAKGHRVRERQGQVLRPLVQQYGGDWVQHVGDETLSSFPSAVDAVNCALAIQAVLANEPELRLRIGIHVGDVVMLEGSLHGDGVNIAARIRPLAEPGEICISEQVRDAVKNQPNLAFRSLGEQALKNVEGLLTVFVVGGTPAALRRTPVFPRRREPRPALRNASVAGAAGLVLLVALGWSIRSGLVGLPWQDQSAGPRFPGVPERPAVAVLPFDNLSGDPEQAFFADGLAEDLTTRLASWRSFPVIARNSSFAVARPHEGEAVDVTRAGEQLGARYVVEGSVRRRADRVRVTVQLIDATTGHLVWAVQYDRDFSDILMLQDEISKAIVGAMYPSLLQFESERSMHRDPDDLDAWSNAQRGWWHFNQETAEDNAQAQVFFERAIELDSLWGWPYAGLALVHFKAIAHGWTNALEQAITELLNAAERAVALDDKDAFGHHALGHAYSMSGQPDKMISAFELGTKLNPNDAMATKCFGAHLALVGRSEEAIEHLNRAMAISPRDPWAYRMLVDMSRAHFAAERYEDALLWAMKSIQQRPNSDAYQVAAASAAHLDRLYEARAAVDDLLRLQPDFSLDGLRQSFAAANPDFVYHMIDGLRKAGVTRERRWPPGGPSKRQPSMRM